MTDYYNTVVELDAKQYVARWPSFEPLSLHGDIILSRLLRWFFQGDLDNAGRLIIVIEQFDVL